MPADLRSPLPSHFGEATFAKKIIPMLEKDVHLWFGVSYLPGVKDIDLLLWDEQVGVFVIEIKAVALKMFERFNLSTCQISSRSPGRSPHGQAQEASLDLRNYLAARKVALPFVVATSAFPLIARVDWNRNWDAEAITGDFAERILFRDDFEGGPVALRRRLAHLYGNPPSGAGSTRKFSHRPDQFAEFDRAVAPPDASPKPAPSDLDRLRVIEREVAREWIEQVPAFGSARIGFTGYPGTGKTFRLLQIGAEHARRGADVLYLCFNKVLAADTRRLLQWSQRATIAAPGHFDVYDVFQLLQLRLEERGLAGNTSGADYEDYGNNSVDLLDIVRDEIAMYDTVLLDEAQDLDDWQVRLAQLHLKEAGTFLFGLGKGQELYRPGISSRLKDILPNCTAVQLRRNFRNTKETFQTAFVAYESKLQQGQIKSAAKRFRTDLMPDSQQGVLFERKQGRFPILCSIDVEELSKEDPSTVFYAEQQGELLARGFSDLIRSELRSLEDAERPIDLLILVPDERGPEAVAAREALGRVGQEYFDLTDDAARRAVVPSTAVRLCTFHSARGIEGNRVLILGFARLKRLSDALQIPAEHLAYIVLSRSVFETVISVQSDEWNREPVVFMQEAIAHLQSPKK